MSIPVQLRFLHNLSLHEVGDHRDAADSRLFTSGGAIAHAELKIVNLKPDTGDVTHSLLPYSSTYHYPIKIWQLDHLSCLFQINPSSGHE